MTRLASLIVLCALLVSLSACGGKDANPTSPSASVFTLNGTVFNGGYPVPGAWLTIMDGVHAGQARTTDVTGRFSFTNLTPSAFTLQATATGRHWPQNAAIDLTTADQSVAFELE
jgi:hypothetical protein